MKKFGLYFWVKEAAKLQLEEPEICNLKIVFFLTKKNPKQKPLLDKILNVLYLQVTMLIKKIICSCI